MARIEHLALWTDDIARSAAFYVTYFGATPGDRQMNSRGAWRTTAIRYSTPTAIASRSRRPEHPQQLRHRTANER
jgi:catechol 2,3-dioxygenase-like lactoylglutathione lyase family enzyme